MKHSVGFSFEKTHSGKTYPTGYRYVIQLKIQFPKSPALMISELKSDFSKLRSNL